MSRVYADNGYVADDVRARIFDAAKKLRYQPDALARGLITGRSNIVAIVMATITNPFYPYVLDLLSDVLQKRGLHALLFNAARTQTVDDLMPSVLQYRVRGVIVTSASLSSRAATLCAEKGVPLVMLNRYARTGGGFTVACDNALGARDAADTLLDAGCRHLAYIGGTPGSSTNDDRRGGFVARLRERKHKPVEVIEGAFTYEWGAQAVDEILAANPALDGVFCGDDAIAFGAVDALRYKHRRRVPHDVSVVGFDDIPVAAWPTYALTTVQQPVAAMVDAAIGFIESPSARSHEPLLLPGTLIRRGTVR